MDKNDFNYDAERDKLPSNITAIIIMASIAAAIYLSFVLV